MMNNVIKKYESLNEFSFKKIHDQILPETRQIADGFILAYVGAFLHLTSINMH